MAPSSSAENSTIERGPQMKTILTSQHNDEEIKKKRLTGQQVE